MVLNDTVYKQGIVSALEAYGLFFFHGFQVYKDSPPPSYQESLKRRQADNGTHTDFGQPKRPRMASEFDHPSSVVQATQGFKVYTPRLATFEPPQNNVTFLASLQQASMPTSANFTDSGSYNPLLTKTMTNPLVPDNSVKHSGDPVISSHGRSIQSYFPFVQPMQIPVNVKHLGTANSSFLNKGHKQEKQQPSLTNTPVSIKTPDSVFGLYRGMQNSMDNLPYNISSDQSKSYSPALNLVQQTSAHVDTINHYIKPEPVTPVGKEGKVTSYHDNSPAMESRFSESLSNLLGSPPPDSPLSKNPFFGDLQNLLTNECKREIIPQSLFQMTPKQGEELKRENVFARERNLQERFTNLQCKHAEEIRQLSSMFRYQSALIETERFRTLHECQYPGTYKDSVNAHYDNKLHRVMDRVERSVELLENADKENKPAGKIPKPRPHLSKSAVRLMEKWYSENTDHPYPDNTTIELLANTGNIGIEQVKKWFANKRNRSQNTRTLTEIAIQKRKLGLMVNRNLNNNETQFGNEHV